MVYCSYFVSFWFLSWVEQEAQLSLTTRAMFTQASCSFSANSAASVCNLYRLPFMVNNLNSGSDQHRACLRQSPPNRLEAPRGRLTLTQLRTENMKQFVVWLHSTLHQVRHKFYWRKLVGKATLSRACCWWWKAYLQKLYNINGCLRDVKWYWTIFR